MLGASRVYVTRSPGSAAAAERCATGTESALVLVMWRMLLTFTALSAVVSCSDSAAVHGEAVGGAGAAGTPGLAGEAGASPLSPVSVEVGEPGGPDGLDFVPLTNGAELRLQTFGQGGTHVLTAVRCRGFGSRAFISATLRNLLTDAEVEEPAPARPQLLYCGDDEICDLVPYLVHASGVTGNEDEPASLPVLLTARARNDAGVSAEASMQVVLSAADL